VRRVAAAGFTALACAGAAHASAPDDVIPPAGKFNLPSMTLRIAPTQITIGTRGQVTFSAVLTRKLAKGRLELILPRPWLGRSPADGARQAKTPLNGTASTRRIKVRRSGRVVRFSFKKGRRGDVGRYTVSDRSLRAATYRTRFVLHIGERQEATATASVVVIALPVRVPEP
jgi:hypothetical protein